jgi:hypothetical protein
MHFRRSDAIYGAFGLVSGFLTPLLSDRLGALLGERGIIGVPILLWGMPIDLWGAGVAFGVALAAAIACVLGFQPRQLLIIPFVMVGWFCAFHSSMWAGPLFGWFVGGAIGALITALGIPVATRRVLAHHSYLAIMLTSTLVVVAWFVAFLVMIGDSAIVGCPPGGLQCPAGYGLFSLWQPLVAMAIGRSIGT